MDTQAPRDPNPRFWTRITGYDPRGTVPPANWQRLTRESVRHWQGAYLTHFPERVRRIWRHVVQAAQQGAAWMVALPGSPARFLVWLRDGIVGALAWTASLGTKLLDLAGLAEAWDFAGQVLKPRTRRLTPVERAEARKVFGSALNYDKVRVDESSWIARLGRRMLGYSGLGIVLGHTVHFNRPIHAVPGNHEMRWLIHELVHVLQCEVAGLQYIGEAVAAQFREGYNYGGAAALQDRSLREFNREQQGDIAADYYRYVVHGSQDPAPYIRVIEDLRNRRI
ncbi:MAG: hypothetical protein AAGN35_15150 [Bacteroidota bacterium]